MNPALILILFEKVLVPELAHWLAARRAQNLPLPTKEEILAKLDADAITIINAGEAFLQSKGVR